MLSLLFEKIRALTDKAKECVEHDHIEQCHIALVERQNLLEKLNEQVSSQSNNDPKVRDKYVTLLLWIQEQDQPNIVNLQTKKQANIKKSIKQIQTKKALLQYKSVQ